VISLTALMSEVLPALNGPVMTTLTDCTSGRPSSTGS
jgi:hypothetical protein